MRRILTLIVIVAALVGGYYWYQDYAAAGDQPVSYDDLQTVSIARGSLTATVGATGTVRARQTGILTWKASGMVGELNVKVGDRVEAGQVLASLDPDTMSQAMILAPGELAAAQNALETLLEPPTSIMLAEAERAILAAQEVLNDAQYHLEVIQRPTAQIWIDQAQANMVLAENNLNRVIADNERLTNRLRAYGRLNADALAGMQLREAQARQDYEDAVNRYNRLLAGPDSDDILEAEAALSVAEAQLAEALQAYDDLLAGADPDDIAAAEARITAAQAALDTAFIHAPFSGTITEVMQKSGDRVSPGGTAFRMDDLSQLLVDVQISEVDVNAIAVGQPVVLVFDALLDEEYQGEVTEIALVGNSDQGMVYFNVTVLLADPDQYVKPGMTAAVTVVVNQLEDVLLVPNRAVRVIDGLRVVFILDEGGVPVPVEIELGVTSEMYSQVFDGSLKVGDQVVVNPPVNLVNGQR